MDKCKAKISSNGEVSFNLPQGASTLSFSIEASSGGLFLCHDAAYWHPGDYRWQVHTMPSQKIPAGEVFLKLNPDVVLHIVKSKYSGTMLFRFYADEREFCTKTISPSSLKPAYADYLKALSHEFGADVLWEKMDSSINHEQLASGNTDYQELDKEDKEVSLDQDWQIKSQVTSEVTSENATQNLEPEVDTKSQANEVTTEATSTLGVESTEKTHIGQSHGQILTGSFRKDSDGKSGNGLIVYIVGGLVMLGTLFMLWGLLF